MPPTNKKLPTEDECLEFALEIAEDFAPKNTPDDLGVANYKLTKAQLIKYTNFCQGNPVQKELF